MEPEVKIEMIGKPKLGPTWYALAAVFVGLAVYSALQPNQFLGTIGWLVSLVMWYLVGTIGGKLVMAHEAMDLIGLKLKEILTEIAKAQAEHLAEEQREKGTTTKEETVH